ncbi:Predicted integral membrane protein [Bordetella ansorpii]|uniref:Predicted integral membrane protein n=1 Tax=Bordetella ansorpii TaxID=288768 RepID=A0A157R2W3_9BORD|nr:Predicted integral membrane protein [Bordetella ansorpii]
MKKNLVSSVLAAVIAVSSSVAVAQPEPGPGGPDGRHGAENKGAGPQGGRPDHGPGRDNGRGRDDRGRDQGREPQRRPDPAPERWSKGQRVPDPYRGHQYVIDDWHDHHLRQPPRGYHWIGVGADYFLVGVATGLVLESVFGR